MASLKWTLNLTYKSRDYVFFFRHIAPSNSYNEYSWLWFLAWVSKSHSLSSSYPSFSEFCLLQILKVYNNVPQCIVPWPVATTWPGNLLEIHVFRVRMYHITRIKALGRLRIEEGQMLVQSQPIYSKTLSQKEKNIYNTKENKQSKNQIMTIV